MASPVRLELLLACPKDVSSLAKDLELEVQQVSHHLRPLYAHGLVTFDCAKKRHVYRLTKRVTTEVRDDELCFEVSSSDGFVIQLRCPVGTAMRWDPPEGIVWLHGLPARTGG